MSKMAEARGKILEDLEGVRCEINEADKLGFLILDRPPVNAITYKGRQQVAAILQLLDEDTNVRVIIIRGANGAYCSGGEIKEFLSFPRDRMSDLAVNMGTPERCRKPVIAAMERFAFGAGFELALACDIRIATESTKLALPEMDLGIIPGSGGTQRLARLIGLGRASGVLMRAHRMSAAEAYNWGILNEVVPDGGLDAAIARWGKDLAANPSVPMTTLKRTLSTTYESPISIGFHVEGQAFEKLRVGPEFKYGIDSYLAKKKPDFSNM